jgi:hypothetical protein
VEKSGSNESFSEIENAKTLLRELSLEFVQEVFTKHVLPSAGSLGANGGQQARKHTGVAVAVQQLEQGIAEFRGTDQELLVVRHLLLLFKLDGDYERWLDLYMRVLYERPTDELVGQLAGQALSAARTTGRERQLAEAFQRVCQIPFDFGVSQQIRMAATELASATKCTEPVSQQD